LEITKFLSIYNDGELHKNPFAVYKIFAISVIIISEFKFDIIYYTILLLFFITVKEIF